MKRFREAGINPKTKFGQNFLIDLNLLDLLFRSADLGPNDVVLEVGGGTGSFTQQLAAKAAHVVTVEIDPQMFQLAREELEGCTNVTMMMVDALKNKNQLNPAVVAEVERRVNEAPGRRLKLAANLPYNVATPIISNLLHLPTPPHSMTVTIQKEMAERLAAKPGTKDYSALSVWVQAQCDVEIVRIMPPTVFWPRPKVDSAIVRIVFRPDLRAAIPDVDYFHAFCRMMFFHRRKFLRKELIAGFKNRLDKTQIDAILVDLGHGPTARAEELDVPKMLALCAATRAALAQQGVEPKIEVVDEPVDEAADDEQAP